MSGKLFAQPPPLRATTPPARRQARWPLLAAALLACCAGASCNRRQRPLTRPAAAVEEAVRPERFAAALPQLGRAHFRGLTRFDVTPPGAPVERVTTETDIWLDDNGNWRLVELNDKDGGREIVRYGHELAVALRYGKMIRRPAEDPEPQHLLEEAVGGPFAAWELLRDVSTVDDFGDETRGGRRVHVYKITKARKVPEPPAQLDFSDRRAWRRSLVPTFVDGTIAVDEATRLPLTVELRARYSFRRAAGGAGAAGANGGPGTGNTVTMTGALEVKASVEEIGTSPPIARPEAEDLALRQRTVPEEKALLQGLPRSAPAPRGAP